ncbi:MAG: mycofactocin biosynthesis glycosyltransferase MftF [Actinobacteria bacterium]|nr:mycofactocin biosynthesis glycosyltransferase MftF [Actinomycetota bacterium]MBU1610145.1 mycofactocin biosynthesis glycosyltransferase MftF [Actinomycetota bacterium]MBU2315487.1 mycofactocin biosynthesis glycosyltransferase MftF [Actinomycetota bacterium]MBU2385288.1 mycofactocin biosynthesis glycosyltransferase MftF [Actinomycetota bacterium]
MKLPNGFTVRLNRRTHVADGGATLVGGVPTRVLYVTALARAMLTGGRLVVTSPTTAALAERLLDAGIADPVVAELPKQAEAVTVVVPVHDRPEAVARLLASIPSGIPVIVVDDCSRNPKAVRDVADRFGANLIALPENLGPASARNAGLAAVTTPFVAFIDSDMVIDADTVPRLLRHFADPRVGLVAPRIVGLEPESGPNWITRYEAARSSLDLGAEPANVRPGARVSWLPAACLVARTEVIGAGFSPGMRVAEDVDLVWRLVKNGWRVRYEPAVEARHEHRRTVLDWLGRKAFYGTGADDLAARHGDTVAPAVFTPWTLVFVGALLAQRRWSLPIAAGAAAVAAVRIGSRLRPTPDRARIAVRLTGLGALAATAQTAELLTRHWWPVAAVGSLVSRRLGRAVVVAAVADAVYEHRRTATGMGLVSFAIARRLDDLAYGAGLWIGAMRERSSRALRPVVRVRSRIR